MSSERYYLLCAAGMTHPGRKRRNNEDCIAMFEPSTEEDLRLSGALYIVADGVGGAARGEKASRYAAEKVLYEYYQRRHLPPAERLVQIMQEVNRDIYEYSHSGGRFMRMATTMVAAAIVGQRLIVANVGDSRAYLLRQGQVRQITRDHNIVGEMIRSGLMTEEEALRSKVKNRLTRSLGGEPETLVDIFQLSIQPGDRILLCSDGLTRYALRRDIARLASQGNPQEVVHRLIDFANQRGGADNVSAILIEVGPPVTAQVWLQEKARQPLPTEGTKSDTLYTQIPTEPLPLQRQAPFRSLAPESKRAQLLLGVLLFSLALVCGFLTGWVWKSRLGPLSPTPVSVPTSPPSTLLIPAVVPPTNTPSPTVSPTPTSVFTLEAGCFAAWGPPVWKLMHQWGLLTEGTPRAFLREYYQRGFHALVYIDQSLPTSLEFVDLTPWLEDGEISKNDVRRLRRLSKETRYLFLPMISRVRCEKQGGRWEAIPEDRRAEISKLMTFPGLTPTPFPTVSLMTGTVSAIPSSTLPVSPTWLPTPSPLLSPTPTETQPATWEGR